MAVSSENHPMMREQYPLDAFSKSSAVRAVSDLKKGMIEHLFKT
jgi:hypothetical protein